MRPIRCSARISHGRHNGYCDPRLLPSLPDHVFRNDGGRFIDVTEQAGIVDREGRGLGVVAADLDDDGRVDLFVANDTTANFFFRNQGGFRFTEEGTESGLAASAGGGNLAGMGVACGDFDGDGRLDLAVTNYLGESTTLYHNHGDGSVQRPGGRGRARRADAVRARLRALRPRCQQRRAARPGAGQRPCRRLPPRGPLPDARAALPRQRRGQARRRLGPRRAPLATSPGWGADWPSATWTTTAEPMWSSSRRMPRSPCCTISPRPPNHFLTLALEGTASNRDAVGARVAVTVLGKTQVAARFGGGSYLSASDHRLHFGLGPARKVDRVEVTWPTGRRDCYQGLAADAGYRLCEGDPVPKPLPGFAPPTIKQ